MYNQPQQHQDNLQLQHHHQICQLCDKKIKSQDSYAGPFNRMCRQCYDHQIVDLENPINFISDGIYIGSQKVARNQALLKQHKINAICVCGSQLKLHDYQQIKVERKLLKILDTANQNISSCFPEVIQWMKQMRNKKYNVLVHCAGGVSRSASICIAYFMQIHKMPYQSSYLHVKRGRKCVKPNQNFTKQLKLYEKQLNYK